MKSSIISFKTMILLLFTTVALVPAPTWAQQKKQDKKAIIKNAVESENYVFIPQTALPAAGNTRQLTYDFDLRVSKDTVVSNLPYFGRAYSAPIDPSRGPLNFTSTKFEYAVNNRKKGGWDILITTKDLQQDQVQFALSIFENGNASVTVNSTNRQPIIYNGYIKPKR
jgi:hypothetical protein